MKLNISIPEDYCQEAKDALTDMLAILNKDTTVSKIDEAALNLLGGYMNLYYTAEAVIRKEGAIRHKKNSAVCLIHPAVKVMNEAGQKMYRLMIEFGMTPRSRDKAGKESDETPLSPFEQFAGKKVEAH